MKKILYIALPAAMLISLNSCDWFNTTFLGKPSKAELAKKKQREKAQQDSIAQVQLQLAQEAEQLALEQQQAEEEAARLAAESKRYHVVVGCFRVSSNADRMVGLLQSKGYNPKMMRFRNGFACISAASFDNIHTAYNEMNSLIRSSDFAPEDTWVYDTTFNLHE
jgi:predicted Holliday junction resolvase-like endonuclease